MPDDGKLRMFKKVRIKRRKQVSQRDVEVLAALLVAFPQISTVTFDPKKRGLELVFLCRSPVSQAKRKKLKALYLQSMDVYQSLTNQKSGTIHCHWEIMDGLHSFHVERDVASLSSGELRLTVSLVAQEVPVVSDPEEQATNGSEFSFSMGLLLQEMLDRVRELKCSKKLVALREGERVIVFHR